MNTNPPSPTSRREFIKQTSTIAAVSALAGMALPHVHAAENNIIQIALVGCGGRGTGAAVDALSVRNGPMQLVAMADVFESQLSRSFNSLKQAFPADVEVPKERQFVGFDGYKHAMDALRPGDIVILTTPPAFRWVHFGYAISKGLNVFMEKPVTVDGPTSKRMFALAETSVAKNLKVGVGLMSRHNRAMQELHKRIQDGEIGDLIFLRGYRMQGPVAFFASVPKPPGISELHYQIQRFHSFIWASGGCFSDFNIHIIDHVCWMKNAWPIRAEASGGRHFRMSPEGIPYIDQNLDTYSVEYTFADGAKFKFEGRCITGCQDIYSSAVHGTKGMAVVSKYGDCGLPSSTYKSQLTRRSDQIWEAKVKPEDQNPYRNEWRDLVAAIRNDQPYNEAKYGIEASLVTSMGRMAAHTGQMITYEDMLDCEHEFAPGLDKMTAESPAPLQLAANGKYPVPHPGLTVKREY
jgi:predicted dehydrogenase